MPKNYSACQVFFTLIIIGVERRVRKCVAAQCKGFLDQTRNCNTSPCLDLQLLDTPEVLLKSVAGEWSNWHSWFACSQSCDGGKHQRSRECVGGQCQGRYTIFINNFFVDFMFPKFCNTNCLGFKPLRRCSLGKIALRNRYLYEIKCYCRR
jgi:hypothetical protein